MSHLVYPCREPLLGGIVGSIAGHSGVISDESDEFVEGSAPRVVVRSPGHTGDRRGEKVRLPRGQVFPLEASSLIADPRTEDPFLSEGRVAVGEVLAGHPRLCSEEDDQFCVGVEPGSFDRSEVFRVGHSIAFRDDSTGRPGIAMRGSELCGVPEEAVERAERFHTARGAQLHR